MAVGYTFGGVALRFNGSSGSFSSEALTVTLRENSETGRPGNTLHTLTNPSRVNASGLNEFRAPAGVVLRDGFIYHVVVEVSSGSLHWLRANTGAADPGSAPGWSVSGNRYQKQSGRDWARERGPFVMAVRGEVAPRATVTVAPAPATAEEGDDLQFTVRRADVTTGTLRVGAQVRETGDMVAPGDEAPRSVWFADGETEMTVTVPTVNDADDEADSFVTLELLPIDVYLLGNPSSQTVIVEDDDNVPLPPMQSLLVTNLERFENQFGARVHTRQHWAQPFTTGNVPQGYSLQGVALRFFRSRNAISDQFLTVTLRANGTDDGPGELLYTLTNPPSLNRTGTGVNEFTAPAGATLEANTRYHVYVAYESSLRPFDWSLSRTRADAGSLAGWEIPYHRYITVDDGRSWSRQDGALVMSVRGVKAPLPTVAVEQVKSSVEEGESAQFRVMRTMNTRGALMVSFSVSENGDMVASGEEGAMTVDFADGATEATVTVPTVDDSGDEANSVVTLTLTADDAYDLGAQSTAAVTVRDNDEPPTLVSNNDKPLGRSHGHNAIVLASRFKTLAQSFTTGSRAAGYALDGIALRFRELQFQQPGRITVTLRANASNDKPGNELHTLRNPSPVDYDGMNEFTVRSNVFLEPDTRYHVVLAFSDVAGGPQWLKAQDDSVDPGSLEGWEIGTRHESSNEGVSWGGGRSSRLIIAVRGTEAPFPEMSVEPVASEAEEGEDAQFRVTRTANTRGALTVGYSVSESGDMVAASDEGAKTIEFAHGDSEKTVTVPTEDDAVHEANSTVTVTLTADAAWELGTAEGEVTVADNDNAEPTGAPVIDDTTPAIGQTLTVDPSGIVDPDGLTNPGFLLRWIRVASDGNERYVGVGSSYTVPAEDLGATLKVVANFTDDGGMLETVESAVTSAVERLMVSVEPVASTVEEGENAQFRVTRTAVTDDAPTISYRVSETGNKVASDEEGAKTVEFEDDATEVTVTVPTVEDAFFGADSTVTVELAANDAFELGAATAEVTVTDDDGLAPMAETLAGNSAKLDAGPWLITSGSLLAQPFATGDATYGYELSGVVVEMPSPGSDVTVTIRESNAEGEPGSVRYTLIGPPSNVGGNWHEFRAPEDARLGAVTPYHVVVENADSAPKEWRYTETPGTDSGSASGWTIDSSFLQRPVIGRWAPAGDSLYLRLRFRGIETPPPPKVTLHLAPASIAEDGGTSTVTASLDRASEAATTVTVSAAPVNPAVAGDYTLSANRELTIPAGQTESTGTVTITAVDNDVGASDKAVTVSATASNADEVADPDPVTLTIVEDDLPDLSIDDVEVAEGDTGSAPLTFTVTLSSAATRTATVDWATSDGTAEGPGRTTRPRAAT